MSEEKDQKKKNPNATDSKHKNQFSGFQHNEMTEEEYLAEELEYYDEGKFWYKETIYVKAEEAAWLFFITCIACIGVAFGSYNVYRQFPRGDVFNMVKYVDSAADEFSIIKRAMDSRHEKPELAVARYLVKRYVINMESYNYSELKNHITYIKNNSSRKLYLEKVNFLRGSSDKNPVNKYKVDITREIQVLDVDLKASEKDYIGEASVRFSATEKKGAAEIKKEFFVAKLSFTLSNIKMVAQKLLPLEFVVLNYDSEAI